MSSAALALSGSLVAGPIEDWAEVMAAGARGDHATVVRLTRALAEAGDADAQYDLGVLFHVGEDLPQDYVQAWKWYAVAAERYRLANGAWPASPDELVAAGLLRVVPDDPFDGRPMRWRQRPDGVNVYSVGSDGHDNGGTPETQQTATGQGDIGFRLYDPADRGRPPAASQ